MSWVTFDSSDSRDPDDDFQVMNHKTLYHNLSLVISNSQHNRQQDFSLILCELVITMDF